MDEDLQYTERIQDLLKQRYQEARSFSGGLFDAISSVRSQPFALPQFFGGFLKNQGKTIFENAAAPVVNNVFGSLSKSFGGQFTTDAEGHQHPTALGKILGGTVFGAIPPLDPAKAMLEITKESVSAEKDLTAAIVSLDTAIRSVGGLAPPAGGGGAAGGGGTAGALGAIGNLFPGAAPFIKSANAIMRIPQAAGIFGGGGGGTAGGGGLISAGGTSGIAGAIAAADPAVKQSLGAIMGLFSGGTTDLTPPELNLPQVGPPNLGFMPSTIADYAGIAAPPNQLQGDVPIRMMDSTNGNGLLVGGKMFQNGTLVEPPTGSNVVNGYVQPPSGLGKGFAQGLGAFGGAIGHGADLKGIFTGEEDIPGTEPGTAKMHLSTSQRVGSALGSAATVAGGTMASIAGFRRGGAKGALQGVSGALAAASVIPGPQQPFVMAGAALTAMISSFIPDPKEVRRAQIDQWMQQNTYRAPVSLDATIAASGGSIVSEGISGLARNTGIRAFPFNVQQNQLAAQSNPGMLGYLLGDKNYTNSLFPYAQGYNFLPGRQLAPTDIMASGAYGSGLGPMGAPMYGASNPSYISPSALAARPSAPAPTNIQINIPVSAMDSQDVLRRSSDIGAAVAKELRNGGGVSDLNYYINQSVFGGG